MKKSPGLRPWPNCTFSLQIEVEDDPWGRRKHVWIDLYREAPGRHGRLKVLHATVPTRKRLNEADKCLSSPSYRLEMIRAAAEVLLRSGVPSEQAKTMMLKVNKVYPSPTKEDVYQEHLNDPLVSMALGERRKELSFYRTGKREWSDQDAQLIEECLDDLMGRTMKDRALMDRFSKLVLGPRSGDHGL